MTNHFYSTVPAEENVDGCADRTIYSSMHAARGYAERSRLTAMTEAYIACQYVALFNYHWDIVPVDETKPRCHGIALPFNPTIICLFVSFSAVTLWLCLEVNLQAVLVFRKWSTVYFWYGHLGVTSCLSPSLIVRMHRSIIFTTWSVILYAISVVIMFLSDAGKSNALKDVVYPAARVCTNLGFIVVLYSRLHLIINAPRTLKRVAWGLLVTVLPFEIWLVVASTGKPPFHMGWKVHYVAYHLEVLVTCVEIALSCCYVFFFAKRFMGGDALPGAAGKRMQREMRWTFVLLVLTELFVIAGDIATVTIWMTGLLLMRLAIDPFIYGLKLKVEFLLLNRLTGMTQQRAELRHISISTDPDTASSMGGSPTDARAMIQNVSAMGCDSARVDGMVLETIGGSVDGGASCQNTKDKRPQVAQRDLTTLTPVATDSSGVLQPRESFDSMERRYLGRSVLRDPAHMV